MLIDIGLTLAPSLAFIAYLYDKKSNIILAAIMLFILVCLINHTSAQIKVIAKYEDERVSIGYLLFTILSVSQAVLLLISDDLLSCVFYIDLTCVFFSLYKECQYSNYKVVLSINSE
jgi:hypothetical protein